MHPDALCYDNGSVCEILKRGNGWSIAKGPTPARAWRLALVRLKADQYEAQKAR